MKWPNAIRLAEVSKRTSESCATLVDELSADRIEDARNNSFTHDIVEKL